MAFDVETAVVATGIGKVTVFLADGEDDEVPYQSANFRVEIWRSDGTKGSRAGDLVPHITPAQRTALLGFMDDLRTQAEGEFLP